MMLFNDGTFQVKLHICTSRMQNIYILRCWREATWLLNACYSQQVNFYHDHTKIILCNQSEEYLLTYINEDRVSTTLRLSTLLVSGCSADLRSRMDYALNMLLQRCNWSDRLEYFERTSMWTLYGWTGVSKMGGDVMDYEFCKLTEPSWAGTRGDDEIMTNRSRLGLCNAEILLCWSQTEVFMLRQGGFSKVGRLDVALLRADFI